MRLEDYQKEWASDCRIDKSQLDDESLKTNDLHSKYMNYLSSERMRYKKLLMKKKEKISILDDYYSGRIDGKDIGREPWSLIDTKAGVEKRIDNDIEIIKLNLIIFEIEEIVLFLKESMANINQRSFNIRNSIEFMKFTRGDLM